MLQQQLSLSPDLKKLRDEGFELEIKNQHLLIHNVPYVNSLSQICKGTIVSTINYNGNLTAMPETHVVYFIGQYPCHKDGKPIEQIRNATQKQVLSDITIDHTFSNKPLAGFKNYYDKMTSYINILSAPASSLDPTCTARTFKPIQVSGEESDFVYFDTNSSRSGMLNQSEKFKNHKIGIIGLGGTGSYILDLISKVPIKEMHLFDGDKYMQHNAFRSPGAASLEVIAESLYKTEYYKSVYDNIHRGIFSHPEFITSENLEQLRGLNFVFICIDKGAPKKYIMDFLVTNKISFIDVGMGVELIDGKVRGSLRITTGLFEKMDHVSQRVSFIDEVDDEYNRNIQLADLNCLNAVLAVIKWKKIIGFYLDLENELNATYDLDGNFLTNDEKNNP